ncbi:MAG: hypothetical protein SOR89_06850 [Ndongobacter sp.]|nr:hypothetical protein [Ndongobacter sp.]
MDEYRKNRRRNIGLIALFAAGVLLQFYGHGIQGMSGLGVQFISLAILLFVLWAYNRAHR